MLHVVPVEADLQDTVEQASRDGLKADKFSIVEAAKKWAMAQLGTQWHGPDIGAHKMVKMLALTLGDARFGSDLLASPPKPPPPKIAKVHLPGERWAEVVIAAIKEGKATKAEVQRLLMSLPDETAPGAKGPRWEEIEAVALIYKEQGHKYDDQDAFVRYCLGPKGMAISVQTFRRWMKQYEIATGASIRPGRGSRKRKPQSKRTT
jgi:hypothetical protein